MGAGDVTFPNLQFGQIEEHPPFVHVTKQLPAILGLGALCDTPACDGTQTLNCLTRTSLVVVCLAFTWDSTIPMLSVPS